MFFVFVSALLALQLTYLSFDFVFFIVYILAPVDQFIDSLLVSGPLFGLLLFLFIRFFLCFLLSLLFVSFVHKFDNLDNNGLIRPNFLPDLINHPHDIFILVFRSQFHHITSGSVNKLIVGGFHVGHDIAFVSAHPAHDQS